nr:MAG TPA: hypothetical protein [Caudoviricetes sp.]
MYAFIHLLSKPFIVSPLRSHAARKRSFVPLGTFSRIGSYALAA